MIMTRNHRGNPAASIRINKIYGIPVLLQAKMLSGRYRAGKLCRHWSTNTKGFCLAPTCSDLEILEDLTHILAKCEALGSTRSKLLTLSLIQAKPFPPEERLVLLNRWRKF